MIVIIANTFNIAEKVKSSKSMIGWEFKGMTIFFFLTLYYKVTIFFHRQSNLKTKDVV